MKRYNLLNKDDLIKGSHFNNERCRTSYVDCEEKYPIDYM